MLSWYPPLQESSLKKTYYKTLSIFWQGFIYKFTQHQTIASCNDRNSMASSFSASIADLIKRITALVLRFRLSMILLLCCVSLTDVMNSKLCRFMCQQQFTTIFQLFWCADVNSLVLAFTGKCDPIRAFLKHCLYTIARTHEKAPMAVYVANRGMHGFTLYLVICLDLIYYTFCGICFI